MLRGQINYHLPFLLEIGLPSLYSCMAVWLIHIPVAGWMRVRDPAVICTPDLLQPYAETDS